VTTAAQELVGRAVYSRDGCRVGEIEEVVSTAAASSSAAPCSRSWQRIDKFFLLKDSS
jgi:hypothetical protein